MLDIFNIKPKPSLGVDISSSAVKIVELQRSKGKFQLKNLGYAKLPEGAIVDNNINGIDDISNAISEALTKANIKTKKAVIAIPGALIISKTAYLDPELTTEEIFYHITENLDQYISTSALGDIALDFYVIAEPTEQQPKRKIAIIACKQQSIDTRLNACEQAGLNVIGIDVETFAINHLIYKQITNQEIASCNVDIGRNSIKFFAILNNEIVFTRELKFGFMQLIKAIRSTYNMSLTEAEDKYINQQLPKDYKSKLETPFCISLANQISQLIQLFYSATNEVNIDKLFVNGGGCELPSLRHALKKKINKPIIIINPLSRIEHAKNFKSKLTKQLPMFTVACSLSLRSVTNDKH